MTQVEACEHGKVDVNRIFGPEARGIIAHMNTEGQHRSDSLIFPMPCSSSTFNTS